MGGQNIRMSVGNTATSSCPIHFIASVIRFRH